MGVSLQGTVPERRLVLQSEFSLFLIVHFLLIYCLYFVLLPTSWSWSLRYKRANKMKYHHIKVYLCTQANVLLRAINSEHLLHLLWN